MKTHTNYLTFTTKRRQEIIDITDEVEACRAAAGIREGFVLVSAMHISASVFVNDHESGLWEDILRWLEERIAPWEPDHYRHNETGEDNAAAHLRSGRAYLEVLRTAQLSCGLYRLRRGEEDQQRPHREEEIYLVMEGRGRFRMGDEDYAAEPGSLLTVPAKVEHGFHGVTEDLLLLVFFAPAEGTSE